MAVLFALAVGIGLVTALLTLALARAAGRADRILNTQGIRPHIPREQRRQYQIVQPADQCRSDV